MVPHLLQTVFDQRPVFLAHGDNIRDSPDRRDIHPVPCFKTNLRTGFQDRFRDFIGNAHACQVLFRIRVPRLFGADHRVSLRDGFARFMMVGYDQLQPKLPGVKGFLFGADPAVNGDDQVGPVFGKIFQRLFIESVAFFKTVRNVADRIRRPDFLQQLDEDRTGGNAVHIIVPVNGDLFLTVDRVPDHLHSPGQVLHPFFRVQRVIKTAALGEEDFRFTAAGNSPYMQQFLQYTRVCGKLLKRSGAHRGIRDPAIQGRRCRHR